MKEILKNTEITVEFSFFSEGEKNKLVKTLIQAFEIPDENVTQGGWPESESDRVSSIKCDADTFQTMFAALTIEAQRIAEKIQKLLHNAIESSNGLPIKETQNEIERLDNYIWLMDDFRKAEDINPLLRFKLARNLFHGEEVNQ